MEELLLDHDQVALQRTLGGLEMLHFRLGLRQANRGCLEPRGRALERPANMDSALLRIRGLLQIMAKPLDL